MADPTQLLDVANSITAAVSQLNEYYDADAFELRFPGGKPTAEQGKSVGHALEALLRLQRMLLGPLGSIMSLSVSPFTLDSTQEISRRQEAV